MLLVTWFKSDNYGTCLQAYATQELLQPIANVLVLDRRTYYGISELPYALKKIKNKIKAIVTKKRRLGQDDFTTQRESKQRKNEVFTRENYNTVSITCKNDIRRIDEWVDCYVVGSDQMWNPWLVTPAYLLDFIPADSTKRRYAFSASFGVDNIPKNRQSIYKKYLPRFDQIYVREPRAAELISELTQKKAEAVLDPTLLLDRSKWNTFAKHSTILQNYNLKDEKFILCYFIGSQEFDYFETISRISEILHCRIIILPMRECDYNIKGKSITVISDACMYDFVSLISNAVLVCTDSFHAVVFSFLMETPFYCFPRFRRDDMYSQESRLSNIIRKFGLENSYWNNNLGVDGIKKHLLCDYTHGYEVLEKERNDCIQKLYAMICEE